MRKRPLRVVHCPVNTAGVPWSNVRGAPAARDRGVARRLQPLRAPPGGRPLARAPRRARPASGRPVARVRRAGPAHRPVPLHLRADARPPVAAVPAPARVREGVGDALPRLRHPREVTRGARLREEGRRRDRRQLRRDPLGAGGDDDPAGGRPAGDRTRAAVRPPAAGRRARAVVAAAEGHRPRPRRLRRPRRRPAHHRRAAPRRGARALPRRRHRRRPAQRRLVRPLRDRVHGARQAGHHVPARRGRAAHRGGLRRARADRQRDRRDAPGAARGARRGRRRPAGTRSARRRARTSSRCTTSSSSPTGSSTLYESVLEPSRVRDAAPSTTAPPAEAGPTLPLGDTDLDASVPARPAPAPGPQAMPAGLGAQLRRLGRHSAIYGIGGLVSRVIAVLLLPLYTRYLTPDRLRPDRDAARPDDRDGADPAGRDHERVLPLLLRRDGRRRPPARPADVVLVHDGRRDARARPAPPLRRARLVAPLRDERRRRPRPRGGCRALGDRQLRAADRALPRRGALGRLRLREPREHLPHDRPHAAARRRPRGGAARGDRRQLQRDADRVPRRSSATGASSSGSSSTAGSSAR